MFATTVSQIGKALEITIEAKFLFKNLYKNNKESLNKASQAKEESKKSKSNVEAIKKY